MVSVICLCRRFDVLWPGSVQVDRLVGRCAGSGDEEISLWVWILYNVKRVHSLTMQKRADIGAITAMLRGMRRGMVLFGYSLHDGFCFASALM